MEESKKKLAFIDLDGVIIDRSAASRECTRGDGSMDWQRFLSPELTNTDVLVPGSVTDIIDLINRGWDIVFLSSRPQWTMEECTVSWLSQHIPIFGTSLAHRLELKPESKKYTKTVEWKVYRLYELVVELGSDEVVFVDDDSNILMGATLLTHLPMKIHTFSSLQEAIMALQ